MFQWSMYKMNYRKPVIIPEHLKNIKKNDIVEIKGYYIYKDNVIDYTGPVVWFNECTGIVAVKLEKPRKEGLLPLDLYSVNNSEYTIKIVKVS